MTQHSENLDELGVMIKQLVKKAHGSNVMAFTARLEESLARIIQGSMPNLTNNKKPELFEGYGPLASFAAKIEIAYAFGLILAEERRNLHAMKTIRNAFAHSSDYRMNFDHPSLEKGLAMLPSHKKPKNPENKKYDHFVEVYMACAVALGEHLDKVNQALTGDSKKASPEKSA